MRLINADKITFFNCLAKTGNVVCCHAEGIVSKSAIEMQPTVDAIPVDWILKWANRNCMYCYDYDYPTEKTDGWFDINNMVKDWGKENGIS